MVLKRAGELGMQKSLKERVGFGGREILEYSVSRCLCVRRGQRYKKERRKDVKDKRLFKHFVQLGLGNKGKNNFPSSPTNIIRPSVLGIQITG